MITNTQQDISPHHLTNGSKLNSWTINAVRECFGCITLICYSTDRSLLWHNHYWLGMQVTNKDEPHYTWLDMTVHRWSTLRKSPYDLKESSADTILCQRLHAASCISSLGNIHRGKTQHDGLWLPRDTAWCFMEALCWGSLNTFKTSTGREKKKQRQPETQMTHLIFMEALGCPLAN